MSVPYLTPRRLSLGRMPEPLRQSSRRYAVVEFLEISTILPLGELDLLYT
jgi:hypothetical protein